MDIRQLQYLVALARVVLAAFECGKITEPPAISRKH
jgi:hypothetical protein